MTENPTIPSTPGPSQPPSLANSTTTPEDVADISGVIDCICEISDDDGFTICCDKCDTWQHLVCVELDKDNVPATYFCPKCFPRSLDVQKAKDIQRHRREEEQAKRSHKKKRPAGTSHKKKELANGTNGVTSGKVSSSTEKTGIQGPGKSVSPKEMQQPSRKRGHRGPAQPNNHAGPNSSNTHHTTHINATNANGTPETPSARNGETESDTDPEKPTRYLREGFTDLGNSPNKYTGADVQRFLHSLVMPVSSPDVPTPLERLIHLNRQELASFGLPKASSQVLPENSRSNPEHSRRRLLLGADCIQGDLITIYKGEVGFQESYKKDRTNQYSFWNHPRPYVLFHPNLPVYVDARRYGSEARFVRRSCRPNLTLKTVVVDHSEICFGLFANQALKPGTELTVSWDWSGALESRRFAKEGFDVHRLSSDHLKELAVWIQQLTHKMGDCACLEGKDCLVNRIRKMADSETTTGKTPNGNGNSRKQRRTNAPTESMVGSKRPTPDRQSVPLKKEEDEEGRSVSPPLSRGKPRSRDLTPILQDVAVEKGEMTGREARKFKDVLSRIEKQQQEEQQPQTAKRRKRNSTVSLTPGTSSLHNLGIDTKDWIKVADSSKRNMPPKPRYPCSLPATGSGPNHGLVEYSVTDAGVGRRASDSPVSSDERITRRTASYSPVGQLVQGSDTLKHAIKTIVRPLRPQYENKAIQTDPTEEEEIPWWSPAAVKAPPRPPRLPLRKRLMQSLLRDREEAAAAVLEDTKKRKLGAVSQDPENTSSPKVPRLSSSGSTRDTTISPSPDAKVSLDMLLPPATLPAPSTNSLSSQATITPDVPVTMVDVGANRSPSSPRPPGPALADLFSTDSDKLSPTQSVSAQGKQYPEKARQNLPQEKPRVNGYRNSSLQVQLPPGSRAINGPSTPTPQSSLPQAPHSASIQPPLMVFPNYVNQSVSALNSSMVNPSPTRTKKMSLEDYGKRKHRADPIEKSDDKFSVKATNEGPVTSTNLSKPPVVSLMEEPTSIADPISGTLSIATALPPPAINSSRLAVEPVGVSPAPKDQRTTSLSSSVR